MNNLFLITGDDEYTKSKSLEDLKSHFNNLEKGINFLSFDKENISLLSSELTTYSFFNDKKLIVVKAPSSRKQDDSAQEDVEAETKKSDWFSDELKDNILNMIEDITLVFYDEGSSKGKLYNFVSKNGTVIACMKDKPFELVKWVFDYCKNQNVVISKQDATHLAEISGNNKQLLVNELSKLLDYIDNRIITKEDIDKMCIRTPETIVFDLTDSMGTKNYKKSLIVLDELLDNKEPIQKLLIIITKHFKSLLLTKACLMQNKNVETELGIKSYPAMKYKSQASNFTLDELIKKFEDLANLDLNSKIGNIDIKVGLQSIILS